MGCGSLGSRGGVAEWGVGGVPLGALRGGEALGVARVFPLLLLEVFLLGLLAAEPARHGRESAYDSASIGSRGERGRRGCTTERAGERRGRGREGGRARAGSEPGGDAVRARRGVREVQWREGAGEGRRIASARPTRRLSDEARRGPPTPPACAVSQVRVRTVSPRGARCSTVEAHLYVRKRLPDTGFGVDTRYVCRVNSHQK